MFDFSDQLIFKIILLLFVRLYFCVFSFPFKIGLDFFLFSQDFYFFQGTKTLHKEQSIFVIIVVSFFAFCNSNSYRVPSYCTLESIFGIRNILTFIQLICLVVFYSREFFICTLLYKLIHLTGYKSKKTNTRQFYGIFCSSFFLQQGLN